MRLNFGTEELTGSLVRLVPSLVGITGAHFRQFLGAFVANGMLERQDGQLFFPGGSPDTSGLDGLIEQVLGRVRDELGRAA